jgi:hypothetical protein
MQSYIGRPSSNPSAHLITYLSTPAEPLFVPRREDIRWPDEEWHTAAYHADPETYALVALVPGVHPAQRGRVLLRLLLASWAGLDDDLRATLARVVRVLVLGLPAVDVATVLLALRRRRANHKHVTRATVRLLVEHPQAASLLSTHRRVLTAAFEHALGKSTARGTARLLGTADLHRQLFRFAADEAVAADRVAALYAPAGEPVAVPPLDLDLDRDLDLAEGRPAKVTATNRGDLAATLVHRYRGGPTEELTTAVERYLDRAVATVPRYPATLALVLDHSTSMRGYGDREWALLSQAVALRLVLERVADRVVTVVVGDEQHGGATDLATGLLDATSGRPDLVAVVSDGFENVNPGDLARVAATLPRVGVPTPVVFLQSTFSHSDDLSLRRPAPALPDRPFWHQADFEPVLLWLLAHTDTAATRRELRDALRRRLAVHEDGRPAVGSVSSSIGSADTMEGSAR